MSEKLTKLVIDRDIWGRGNWGGLLLTSSSSTGDNKKCCIGIYLSACGVPDQYLAGRGTAVAIQIPVPEQAQWLIDVENTDENSRDARDLMHVNDSIHGDEDYVDETERERLIAEGFKKQGIDVTFIN